MTKHEPTLTHSQLKNRLKSEDYFGPPHGFAQISDLYGAAAPGFYNNKKIVITRDDHKKLVPAPHKEDPT